ncbi:hypothetical protein GPALN_003735 [Globodera pallida]|nr:hypothetical protein GPALN_003735 [Globodera pallida]
MDNNSSGNLDSASKKNNNNDCSSSTSSPNKKKSRLNASSSVFVENISGDAATDETSPDSTVKISSNELCTSASIPSWVAGASPAKFVSLEDLIKMNDCVEKMNIAHKIATDPNCTVEDFGTKDPFYDCVKSNIHKAYWDLLREDLTKDPPGYQHALSLLEDLKKMLSDHLESAHLQNALSAVHEIIDLDKLRSLLDQGILDFEPVLKAILGVMERLCAPIRDEVIADLKDEADIIKLFKGIFSLVEFMQIDMANFKLTQNRQLIGSYSAQIEFDEFMKLMDIDKSSSNNTKRWFDRILSDFLSSSELRVGSDGLTRSEVNGLIAKFYLALLTSNPADRIHFPETLKLDEKHLDALGEKFLQLELTLSAIFISANLVGKSVCEGSEFKKELKRDLIIVLNDINWSNCTQKLDNVYVQCGHKCKAAIEGWDDEKGTILRQQLAGLCRTDDPIRVISRKRICEFIDQALLRMSSPLRIPPGLSTVQTELASLTSRFYAIAVHNWNGFGRFYGQLLDQMYEAKVKQRE